VQAKLRDLYNTADVPRELERLTVEGYEVLSNVVF
jgi:hypothetical protein